MPKGIPGSHPLCSVEGCKRRHNAKGLCKPHYYQQWWRARAKPRPSFEEQFWQRVDRSGGPDACWPWQLRNGKPASGYGGITRSGQAVPAHRMAWILTFGPIPAGLFACHRCDNPPCCNSGHLFLGTAADNNADMMAKGRHRSGLVPLTPQCSRGHTFTAENTYWRANGTRICRICHRLRAAAYAKRKYQQQKREKWERHRVAP